MGELRFPSDEALSLAAEAASHRGNCPVRSIFVRSQLGSPRSLEDGDLRLAPAPTPHDEVDDGEPTGVTPASASGATTPLARVIGGGPGRRAGRGGSVRLKLYLTLLWLSGGQEHRTSFAARAYSRLFDLTDNLADRDADSLGVRRVLDALKWLEAEEFVRLEALAPSKPRSVVLLHERGDGTAYARPRTTEDPAGKRVMDPINVYFDLPKELWTNGWLTALSGSALAMLLVLADHFNLRRDKDTPRGIPASVRRSWYVLSDRTWAKGIEELSAYGLVTVVKRNTVSFGPSRLHTVYLPHLDRLKERCAPPAPVS